MKANRIRIGVSSCLLGDKVRYDGAHKRDRYVASTLARYFELVPVCPEVGIGMGVPRAPIRLVGRMQAPRAVGRDNPALDVTEKLFDYGVRLARELDDLSGYVFKSRSPSCGLARVPVLDRGRSTRVGRGIYAQAFLAVQPWLPAEEEDRLMDPAVRENFLERVFAYRRWQEFTQHGVSAEGLREFHAAHRLALMAHDLRAPARLERIAAARGEVQQVAAKYLAAFMSVLARSATTARHERTLLRLLPKLRGRARAGIDEKFRGALRRMRAGKIPRRSVLTMLRRELRRHPDPSLADQVYLYPGAQERALRRL